MALKNFIHNLRYLFRYNLKSFHNDLKNINETYVSRYELISKLMSYKKPKIKTGAETINDIITKGASICRFGDGEFELIQNISIPFQEADGKLAQRLKEVLKSNENNCLIAIGQYWESDSFLIDYVEKCVNGYVSKKLYILDSLIDKNREYYLTSFNQAYVIYNDNYDFEKYFNDLRKIWQNRDITIICGKNICDKFQHDIFDCAKSVEYRYAPSKNAFSDYENIFEDAQKIPKDRLVLIILGPTATVLAYDLHKLGYQALDIGHCSKDYNAYKTKKEKSFKTCCEFFAPD